MFTGTSHGSQIVPPEWCSQGLDWRALPDCGSPRCAVAPALVQIHDEGEPLPERTPRCGRRSRRCGRIAGVLRELRRRRADDLFQHPRLEVTRRPSIFAPARRQWSSATGRRETRCRLRRECGRLPVRSAPGSPRADVIVGIFGRLGDAEILAALACCRSPAPVRFGASPVASTLPWSILPSFAMMVLTRKAIVTQEKFDA